MTAPDAPGPRAARWRLAGIGLLALGIAAALYAAGRLHQPDYTFSMFGADPIPPKSLLATIALALAGVQVLLGLWMYRKLPLAGSAPRPVPVVHRVTGFAVFALTVPVAVHCLIAYGVQLTSPRVAIHSVAGCFFYGAFTAKVLLVQSKRLPGWALPVAGGTLAIIVGVLWYTSALWYYNGYQLPHL
jgi:heme A synthase